MHMMLPKRLYKMYQVTQQKLNTLQLLGLIILDHTVQSSSCFQSWVTKDPRTRPQKKWNWTAWLWDQDCSLENNNTAVLYLTRSHKTDQICVNKIKTRLYVNKSDKVSYNIMKIWNLKPPCTFSESPSLLRTFWQSAAASTTEV